MPKIMFRPNPTPPPFVPPTPVYPTNSIELSPFPFNAKQNVDACIHNLTLPSGYDEYYLCYYVPAEDYHPRLVEIDYQPIIEEWSFSIYVEHDSTDISGIFVECDKGEEEPYYFPLTIV